MLTRKELRQHVVSLVEGYGLRLALRPQAHRIELLKAGVIVSYPYSTVSDTLQRMVLYTVAIETSEDAVLILEEPEAHTFPYYTKHLAERIALDPRRNHYFIVERSPSS